MNVAAVAPPSPVLRSLRWGVIWGLAVTLAESLIISRGSHTGSGAWLTFWLAPVWCLTGWLLAAGIFRAEERFGGVGAIVAWFVISIAAAAVYIAISATIAQFMESAGVTMVLPQQDNWLATPRWRDALLAYHTWINLVFGAPLAAAISFDRRSERGQRMLHDARIARTRAALMIEQARLESLRTRVDPALLVETLSEIRVRYAGDPAAAEQLLESLVGYLRAAMAGMRPEQPSTPDTEIKRTQALAELQRIRGVTHG